MRCFYHQRQAPLSVARRRSGRQCPRYPGTEPTQQAGREAVFPQAPEGITVRAAGHHYGQVEKLRWDEAGGLKGGSVEITSGKYLLLPGNTIIPNNLTKPARGLGLRHSPLPPR